jgi:CheY-like chemotaxis protein
MCPRKSIWSEKLKTEIEEPTVHKPALETYRILTLEDAENIDKLKDACRDAGHQVVPVLTIRQAMEFLDIKDHVDVIISATHLHHESVFDFLRRVKSADSIHRNVPFVMLCLEPGGLGRMTSDVVESVAEIMGADHYILMPKFDADELLKQIEPLFPPVPLKELDPSPHVQKKDL